MSVSFATTAYDEMSDVGGFGSRILQAISAAREHKEVREIVIVDDGSSDYEQLERMIRKECKERKVKLFHNETNRGVFGNKLEAIARSTGEWVVTCDSDNVMDKEYLDRIIAMDKHPDTWYLPSFARPEFDYRGLVGEYRLADVPGLLAKPIAGCLINTGNQTVHQAAFMKVFAFYRARRFDLLLPNYLELSTEERVKKYWRLVFDANDSFLFNKLWLEQKGQLHVVEGLHYDHHYSTGADSNYSRAPEEKGKLNKLLVADLIAQAREQK